MPTTNYAFNVGDIVTWKPEEELAHTEEGAVVPPRDYREKIGSRLEVIEVIEEDDVFVSDPRREHPFVRHPDSPMRLPYPFLRLKNEKGEIHTQCSIDFRPLHPM